MQKEHNNVKQMSSDAVRECNRSQRASAGEQSMQTAS